MMRLLKKLRLIGRRRELDRDLEDELRFHLEMKAGETGDPAEARRLLGNATAWSEKCRELWIFGRIETWWQDVRYALRTLAKTPGFTAVAVAALALGIGADTAIFTIANGAFTWNLGLEHLDRTVLVNMTDAQHRQDFGVSYPDFLDLRAQARSFAGLAAYQFASANLSDSRTFPERYHLVTMSANGFTVSEQRPALGRVFVPADERPGAPPVVVLTYAVWQDRYGKDQAIVGKTIRVNEVPVTVIGVMPSGKRFPEETDLWMPMVPDARLEQRGNRYVTLFGLLAEHANMAAARAEIHTIAGRLAKQYPDTDKDLIGTVQPIAEITGVYNMRPLFTALWAAVGFVLLIACADVANMLLVRGAGRMREICIRVAVGAGRTRIIRQLLIESVLLSVGAAFWAGWLRWADCAGSMPGRA